MSESGIHKVDIAYTDGTKHTSDGKPVSSLCVELGDGQRVEIDATKGPALLRLVSRHGSIALDSQAPCSTFERAINILRLRIPMRS